MKFETSDPSCFFVNIIDHIFKGDSTCLIAHAQIMVYEGGALEKCTYSLVFELYGGHVGPKDSIALFVRNGL